MHEIVHWTYDIKTNKQEILAEASEYADRNGDYTGQIEGIRYLDNVYDSYEDAVKATESLDRGWYDNFAVKYRDVSSASSAKITDIQRRIKETKKKEADYIKAHDIHTFKSQFIGCKECGSKLSISHMRGNSCPLCSTDLRSETTLNTIKSYEEKIKTLQKQELTERKKQASKSPLKWLVKFEFHY